MAIYTTLKQFYLMKNIKTNLLIITCILFVSCIKEETKTVDQTTKSDLSISFNNTVQGNPINSSNIDYTNASGNKYSVSILKYYVTNIVLVDINNNQYLAKNYNLIDIEEPSQNTFLLKNVPFGTYKSINFILGVDSVRNNSGVQDGFLDPSYGMIWTWNTGYIFFKHEGSFKDSIDNIKPLRFHLGTTPGRGFVEVSLPNISVNNQVSGLTIDFDLNKAYSAKMNINFNFDNDRQSLEEVDRFWIATLKGNLEQSFSFGKIK